MSFNPGGNGFEQQGQGGRESDDEDDSKDNESSQSGADSERQFLSDEEQDQLRRNIEQSESDALDRIGPGRGTLTPREGESGGAPGATAGEEDIINDSDTGVPETGTGPNTLTPEGGQSGGDVPEGTGEDIVNSGSSNQSQQTTPDEGAFDDGLDVDPDTISSDESGQTSTPSGSGSSKAATESQTGGTVDVPEDPVRTDDSFDPDPQTGQESARAPRGPDGDVESPTEAARRRDKERGDIGDFAVQNPVTGNRVETDLERASQDFSDATTFKDVPGPAGKFFSGASQAVNVPGIALGAKEGVEAGVFAARNVDDPGKVFDVAVGETVATGDRTAEAAQERPAETAGALTGGIIAGTAATRTARRASLPTGSRTSTSSLRQGNRGQANFPDQQTIEVEKTIQKSDDTASSADAINNEKFASTDELIREKSREIARERTPGREQFDSRDEFQRAVERRSQRIDDDEVIETVARQRASQQLPDPSEFGDPDEFVRELNQATDRFASELRDTDSNMTTAVDSSLGGSGSAGGAATVDLFGESDSGATLDVDGSLDDPGDGSTSTLADVFGETGGDKSATLSSASSGGAAGAGLSAVANAERSDQIIFPGAAPSEETTTTGTEVVEPTQTPTGIDDGVIFDVGTETQETAGIGTAEGDIFQPTDTDVTQPTDTDTDVTQPTDTDTDVTQPTDTTTDVTQPTDTTTDVTQPTDIDVTQPTVTPTLQQTLDNDSDNPRRRRFPFPEEGDEEYDEAPRALDAFEEAFGSGIRDVDLSDL